MSTKELKHLRSVARILPCLVTSEEQLSKVVGVAILPPMATMFMCHIRMHMFLCYDENHGRFGLQENVA